jgi:glucan-binding YG repeat protein
LVEDTEVDLTELEDISITGLGITTEIEEVETQSERKERKEAEAKAKAEAEAAAQTASYTTSSGGLTKSKGVVYYNGHRETYYSQRVLPGTGLNIPGRHVAEDGTIRDGDGYIVLASDLSYAARGTIIQTSLGTGKVYDTGCAYGTIDIYTDW